MLELFGVLFITLFLAFLLTLVLTNLAYMMFIKGDSEILRTQSKQRSNRKEHSPDELQVLMEAARNVAERGNKELVEGNVEKNPIRGNVCDHVFVDESSWYQREINEDVVESKALKDCYKAWVDFDLGWDFGSNKDRSTYTRYKQKHGGTIEFIDCKWDEDWKEVNEVQEKYLETLPKHKTRIKLRNKRKGKK
ncbi:MAG: hypothetical protein RR744_09305 [Cellulosilyticaceae bacterium]